MDNWKVLLGVIGGTLVLVFGVSLMFSREPKALELDRVEVVGERRHVKGALVESDELMASESAEVAEGEIESEPENSEALVGVDLVEVVEFSDFQCPACKAVQPLVNNLLDRYGEQMVLIYRHFPLRGPHPFAQVAAQASEVAAEYGKFWEYHDVLFERQSEWSGSDDPKVKLADYAEELGIDRMEFEEKLETEAIRQLVNNDYNYAFGSGLSFTPTFVVNGLVVEASQLEASITEAVSVQ